MLEVWLLLFVVVFVLFDRLVRLVGLLEYVGLVFGYGVFRVLVVFWCMLKVFKGYLGL